MSILFAYVKNFSYLCGQNVKTMKKTRFWILLTALMVIVSGCKKGINDPDDISNEPLKYAAVNINDATKDADILLACSNGSYMLCDVNHDNKCGVIYFSTSRNNYITAGYVIYVDSTGTPMLLVTNQKQQYYLKNVTESSCDVAHNYGEEMVYFWDVQLEGDESPKGIMPRKGTASWGETITSPFTTWWSEVSSFDWTWDKHQRKAILPFLAKVTSFAITAVTAVGDGDAVGVLTTIYEEALKSGLVDGSLVQYIDSYERWNDFKDDYKALTEGVSFEDVKGFAIGKIASRLNDYADDELANLATFDEISWEIFNHPENHISLSRYVVNVPQSGGLAMIKVTAQNGWRIDRSKMPDWISYSEDYENNLMNFTFAANESASAREHTFLVYPPSNVQPARLTIKQEGYAFSINPTSITFSGSSDHKAILVQASSKVKSWRVTSCPNWLTYETSTTTIWLDTKGKASGTKTGSVVVEATFVEGGTVSKTCSVVWYPSESPSSSWDGTSWAFSGQVNFSDGSGGVVGMQLNVHSVASHSATVTLMGTQMSCNISASGSNSLKGSFSYQGFVGSFTVTRTGETTATCALNLIVPGDDGTGTGSGSLTGYKL